MPLKNSDFSLKKSLFYETSLIFMRFLNDTLLLQRMRQQVCRLLGVVTVIFVDMVEKIKHQTVDHAPYRPQVSFHRPVLLVVMIGTIVSSDRIAVSVHAHEVGHNAARRIETFAHVRRIRVQEKAVGIIEVEYGLPT